MRGAGSVERRRGLAAGETAARLLLGAALGFRLASAARLLLASCALRRPRARRVRAPRARRAPWLRSRRACALRPRALRASTSARARASRSSSVSVAQDDAGRRTRRRRLDGARAGALRLRAGAAAARGAAACAGSGAAGAGAAAGVAARPADARGASPSRRRPPWCGHAKSSGARCPLDRTLQRQRLRRSDAQRLVAGVLGFTHQSSFPGLRPFEIHAGSPAAMTARAALAASAHADRASPIIAAGFARAACHEASCRCRNSQPPANHFSPAPNRNRSGRRLDTAADTSPVCGNAPGKPRSPRPAAAQHVSHLPAPMPNPIDRTGTVRYPRPCVAFAESAPQSLPQLAHAVGAAVARRGSAPAIVPACDRLLDLAKSRHHQSRLIGDRQGLQASCVNKRLDLGRADRSDATTFSCKPRAKALLLDRLGHQRRRSPSPRRRAPAISA